MSKSLFSLLFVVFLLVVPTAHAQEMGKIQGLIVDAENGEPLIGANAVVKDAEGKPAYGISTNLDGRFTLVVPVGTHNLEVSYVSYATKVVTGIEVKSGATATVNVSLPSETVQGQEIVVTARAEENSEVSMLALQQRAAVVTDGISSELMSRSSSSDAGDALKRVTGITMVDKYVYVRGLGERYSNTQLNGADVPSPEPNRRVVPMDIFPAGLLENIQVAKTFSPDLPGDFSGGSVQIRTRDFPSKLTISASASAGYNSKTTFKDVHSYAGGARDFLGYDDGTRAMPEAIKTEGSQQPLRRRGLFTTDGFTSQELQVFGLAFNNVWSPQIKSAPVNQGYSVSIGNAIGESNRELGYIFSFTYDNDYRNQNDHLIGYRVERDFQTGEEILSSVTDYQVNTSTFAVQWGTLFNTSLRLSPLHKLSVKTMYNRNADDEARIYEGYNADRATDLRVLRLRYIERGIFTGQLQGEHKFDRFLGSNIDWQVNMSRATRNEPDSREILYEERNGEWFFFNTTQSASRFFFDLEDKATGAKVDWSIPFESFGARPAKFKLGGYWTQKDRTFDVRRFRFEHGSGIWRVVDLRLPPEEIFAQENIAPGRFEIRETTQATDNYNASIDIQATYMMVDMPMTARWRFVGGLRIETADQHLTSYDPFSPVVIPIQVDLHNTDILPGTNLIYKLTEKTNLRTAYSRTLARPDFRELAPFQFDDIVGGRAETGNPDLKRTRIDNLDFRFEHYPRLGELMAVSFFYKKFHDPIEQIVQPTSTLRISYQNALGADNYGLEIEFRRRLDVLTPALENFFFNTNLTVVQSNIQIDPNVGLGVQTSGERPLQGQSPYVVNTMLGYDHLKMGFQANLLYNVFGKRIRDVGAQGLPDIYEQPRHQLDFNMKKKWSAMTFKFSAKNLLNNRVEFKQRDAVASTYEAGRSFSIGLSYDR